MPVTYTVNPASGDSYATIFLSSDLKTKIGILPKGTVITVLSSNSTAYKIDHKPGVSTSTSGVIRANSGLNARSGPGSNYAKVGAFNNGATVTILQTQNGWMKVSGGKLSNVWVSSQYVKTSDKTSYGYVSKTDIKLTTTTVQDTDTNDDWRTSQQINEARLRASVDADNLIVLKPST